MHTLQIEHPVTDFDLWTKAFDRLAAKRREEGVLHQRVSRPDDDPAYVVVALDFADRPAAERFLEFLHAEVWSRRESSPALDGAPQTRILSVATDG